VRASTRLHINHYYHIIIIINPCFLFVRRLHFPYYMYILCTLLICKILGFNRNNRILYIYLYYRCTYTLTTHTQLLLFQALKVLILEISREVYTRILKIIHKYSYIFHHNTHVQLEYIHTFIYIYRSSCISKKIANL